METSFSSTKKKKTKVRSKIVSFLLVFAFIFVIALAPIQPVKAQGAVITPVSDILKKVGDFLSKLWQKGGSLAFQQVLRSALNKVAYDTANYLGSGGEGQQPLFITQDWGDYLTQIGDEAAGQFLEDFSQNLSESNSTDSAIKDKCDKNYEKCTDKCLESSQPVECASACSSEKDTCMGATDSQFNTPAFNVCQPSSLEAKLQISLGLADVQRPTGANCTASEMVQNWGDAAQKYADFKDPDFLNKFKGIFNPQSNDLGIYLLAKTDLANKQAEVDAVTKVDLTANKGWLQKVGIDKGAQSLPSQAEREADQAGDTYSRNFGQSTGDAFVDAANIFLNQLAMSGFSTLMQNIGKKTPSSNDSSGSSDYQSDPSILFGESALQEVTSSIIKPNFGVRTDYDILAELAICVDKTNPGPVNCVIDNKLMQGITEKKTVAEAIADGYLYGDWQLTEDTREDSYSLRNISIMRKYRILPIGWEVIIKKAYENSNAIKKLTLMDAVSCFDPYDEYNDFSADFDPRNQGWCQGLVDPNWVLKAPLNYCKKQGAGAQILNTTVIPGYSGTEVVDDTPSSLILTRVDDYCADNQTCIKEKSDGSCEVYGYCNEEERVWKFDSESCDPIYNTCETFINSDSGKNVSYLKNTLDYGECNADNSGCKQYSFSGNFATSTNTVDWNTTDNIYFNKNISSCSSDKDACTELMRIKPAWGTNLVMDSDFSQDTVGQFSTDSQLNDWPFWSSGNNRRASIVNVAEELSTGSGKALKLEATGSSGTEFALGTFSDHQNSLIPDNLEIIPGQSYTLSASVYISQGTKVHLVLGGDDYDVYEETQDKNTWKSFSITRTASNTFNELDFAIVGYSSTGEMTFYIKDVKLEMSDWSTGYTSYGADTIYEKLLPNYLADSCYIDPYSANKDYRLKTDAPDQCDDYARRCNKDEVGCELYVSTKDDFTVPAQVDNADYCPDECVGYDIYISRETHFNSPQADSIIPDTAQSCSAEAVGCNEFTNLDQLTQGGEQKEYYTSLKHCVQPGQSSCSNFYAWEGTSAGYQLRVYTLQLGSGGGPAVTADDSDLCTAEIYALSAGDPGYNPDCREFYNQTGQIFYHLDSRTITCSDNCHAYRLSEKNIDRRLTEAECTGSDKNWDAGSNNCYVCLNGGSWDDVSESCIYQAIPGEGKTCSAEENGCREYNGNDGNNIRMISNYNYESGIQNWFSNCIGGISVSTISNNKDGHSLAYNSTANNCSVLGEEGGGASTSKLNIIKRIFAADDVAAQVKVGNSVAAGKAYTIKFLAQAPENTNVQISLYNTGTKEESLFSPVKVFGGSNWQVYQANLDNLDHSVDSAERLVVTADKDFYLDNFVLTEVTDRYYLIKGSSQIPDICYYDIFDNYQGTDYNLGCSAYLDRSNVIHNLHQFSSICSDSAVGCEQMITTNNYDSYKPGLWNDLNDNGNCDADEPDCVKVDGDEAIYAVYDSDKRCSSNDQGCSMAGQGQSVDNSIVWSDVFVKNNPNQYDQLLCSQADLGCEEWSNKDSGGYSYFKNPNDNTCVYRQGQDPESSGKAWYKVPVKRCDADADGSIGGSETTGAICSSDDDCGDYSCIIDNNDYPCSVSYFKTIGLGGGGNQVPTPDQEAALCQADSSTCTEYIDPVSRFSANLVYNPGYESINIPHEGWGSSSGDTWYGSTLNEDQQVINIEQNKLYILSSDSDMSSAVSLDFAKPIKELLSDNTFADSVDYIEIPGDNHRIIFNSLSNKQALVSGGAAGKVISVKDVLVNYQLQSGIDKKSCNGLVNFDNGCILFNERSVNGSQGLNSLIGAWDAYSSEDGDTPVVCDPDTPSTCTANELIKVRPDRVCSTWLDCITYVQDPQTKERTCYAIGECNRLDDRNECSNFIDSDPTPLEFDLADTRNNSGYSFINKYNVAQMEEVGLDSEVHYDFEDAIPPLYCEKANGGDCAFNENIVKDSLIREPEGSPTDYPAHGESYLKVPAAYVMYPHSKNIDISLARDADYYINYLVNTHASGLTAQVKVIEVLADGESVLAAWEDSASDGWDRKIHKFTTPNHGTKIKVSLSVKENNNDGNVYFDDINIEPVLKVAPNEYVAKECRLYPTADSLTCFNKNNNVISDGLEGYCLEHDLDNPAVCLMWYPVDQILSSQGNRSSLGYQGTFPLNYCTAVDANFELLEKREIVKHKAKRAECGDSDSCEIYSLECNGDSNYIKVVECDHNTIGNKDDWLREYCIPKSTNLKVSQSATVPSSNVCKNLSTICNGSDCYDIVEGWGDYDGFQYWSIDECSIDGDCDILDEANNDENAIKIYDYNSPPSSESGLKLLNSTDRDEVYQLTCNQFIQVVDGDGMNKAWTGRVGLNSEWSTSTPPYFVDDSASSPLYFGDLNAAQSYHRITGYGRNRGEIPFGAAKWPDDFNLLNTEEIPLQNQYSKDDNVDIYAGRPYGCVLSDGIAEPGCDNIGYCSLNPNVYCIYADIPPDEFNINQRTCSDGGFGQCVPLWQNALGTANNIPDFVPILKTVFLKSYNSYEYNPVEGAYEIASNGSYDFSSASLRPGQCTNNIRPTVSYNGAASNSSFCAVFPDIENMKLKFNNTLVGSSNPFNILKKGIYTLEFNTKVDIEQQPLKNIYIDWGDDSKQIITGQDYKPSEDNPHVFYHFYRDIGEKTISITIWDNWDYYGGCAGGICTMPPY